MNNITVTVNTVNTSKVATVLLSMLATLDYGKVTINKYDRIGVIVEIEEIEVNSAMYDELVDFLRDLRKLNDFYKDRIDATLQVNLWGNEYEYSYYYNNDWCGNITFEEYGDLHMDDNNDDDNDE